MWILDFFCKMFHVVVRNACYILQCKGGTESLLLWLSIIRKVFTPVPTAAFPGVPIPSSLILDPVPVPASANGPAEASAKGHGDLKAVQQSLLRDCALIPALVSSNETMCFFLSCNAGSLAGQPLFQIRVW